MSFKFTDENLETINGYIAQYPHKRSAILWCLHIAQKQNAGYLSKEAIAAVANVLDMSSAQVYEVASFYKMFKFRPIGTHLIQVCTSVSCWLRGSDEILSQFLKVAMINNVGDTSRDGYVTVEEICCIGACSNAPAILINEMPYEDLDRNSVTAIVNKIKMGKELIPGSCKGRVCSSKNFINRQQ